MGSMTAELGPVQRARCRRLDHGKHVLCCGEWTRAAGRWLPCWEAASSAVLLGLEKAAASSCPSGDALLFILPTFSNPETWSSELFKATHAPFSVVPYSAYAPVMPPPTETTHVHNTVSIALCLQPPAEGLNFYN